VEQGGYRLSRIDYNLSFELPSRSDVKAWLRAAEFKAKSRHGRPSSKGSTLYFGKMRALYFDYLRSLEMNEQISLSSEQLHSLLQRLRSTYILWMFGRGSPRYLA
jgi:hypothetical protein